MTIAYLSGTHILV